MEWLLWALGVVLMDPPFGAGGSSRPTDVDLVLVELAYGVIASESPCPRCFQPLGRGIVIEPATNMSSTQWSLVIRTRCASWRRHRSSAAVTTRNGEIVLGG